MDTNEPTEPEPAEPGRATRPEAPTRPGALLDLIDPDSRLTPERRGWVIERAQIALDAIGAPGEVRVKVVGDSEMALAHELHKNVPGTTDVLTFDLEPDDDALLDTDILVCADEAARQAARLGHAPERELLLYIVHGVLHCVGYNDADEASARAMHRREDELLEHAGVGVTFARDAGGDS